jgi:hypothetical protein
MRPPAFIDHRERDTPGAALDELGRLADALVPGEPVRRLLLLGDCLGGGRPGGERAGGEGTGSDGADG